VITELHIHGPTGPTVVTLHPADQDRVLSDLLRSAGLPLNTRCGQRGLCQGCLVELVQGTQVTSARACETRVAELTTGEIRLPTRSLLAHEPQVVTSFRLNVTGTHDPLWQLSADGRAVRVYRENGWNTSSVEQLPGPHLGAAIDIGTTTVVVALTDLNTGEILAQTSALNGQTRLGDNVLTRINLCMTDESAVIQLQRAVVAETIGPLLETALKSGGHTAAQLRTLTIAANTTMLHLLAGVDPSSLGVAPFTPQFCQYRQLTAAEIHLKLPSHAHPTPLPAREGSGEGRAQPSIDCSISAGIPPCTVHLLPSAAAYVGADVVAGVLATGMAYNSQPCLLLDLGTNGEIVLGDGQNFWACSTAAGPAFEGAGLVCGVRAGEGAISHIWFDEETHTIRTETIGGGRPIGLCGTAYVDFLARGRAAGVLDAGGRIVPEKCRAEVRRDPHHGQSVVVAQGLGKQPLTVSAADVSTLLQAKAAIAAGVTCLLRRAKLTPADIATVYLAGGFGFHMHLDSLLGAGLLPGFTAGQIQAVGNTSLAGAYAALLDSSFLDELRQLAARLNIVELNLEPDFESLYIDHLALP